MDSGIERIAAERRRQVESEGWTPAHDDAHDKGELCAAADCYAANCLDPEPRTVTPVGWPWDKHWWKPSSDPVRNLEKAGALYRAERERLERRETAIAAKIDARLRDRGEPTDGYTEPLSERVTLRELVSTWSAHGDHVTSLLAVEALVRGRCEAKWAREIDRILHERGEPK